MRSLSPPALALGALFLSSAPPVHADAIQFHSGEAQTALLELYTSEGCSSCPPAEAWLSRLKQNPNLWRDFVPVSFHVDYWDSLGWKDPYAIKTYTERQRAYADQWRSRSVYTPGFVLDGKEWRGWINRNELPRASQNPVGVFRAHSEDGSRWTLRFQPVGKDESSAYDFHAVLLGFELTSDVKAGENRGHRLQHDFVVLAMAAATTSRSGDFCQAGVSLTVPANISPKRLAVAAWVTPSKSLRPLQAVGGWLSPAHRVP